MPAQITPAVATFSIAAYDPHTGALGVAVASKFPAAGAVVPWVKAGVCAVATQSYANTSFGPTAFELIASGSTAGETLDAMLASDDSPDVRQVGIVDAEGRAATFTGSKCHAWAGGKTGKHHAVQGNILTGEETIHAMDEAYTRSGKEFPERLAAALLAGDRAGGDRRGRQSAAIYVALEGAGYGGYNDRWIDYRVDDHPDPVPRLQELLALHRLYFEHSDPSDRLAIEGEVLRDLCAILLARADIGEPPWRLEDPVVFEALSAFIGNENFEERASLEEGWIDRPVLDHLRRKFLQN